LGLGLATGAYKEPSQKIAVGGISGLLSGVIVHLIHSGEIAKAEEMLMKSGIMLLEKSKLCMIKKSPK
jgi:hypothetical protein